MDAYLLCVRVSSPTSSPTVPTSSSSESLLSPPRSDGYLAFNRHLRLENAPADPADPDVPDPCRSLAFGVAACFASVMHRDYSTKCSSENSEIARVYGESVRPGALWQDQERIPALWQRCTARAFDRPMRDLFRVAEFKGTCRPVGRGNR